MSEDGYSFFAVTLYLIRPPHVHQSAQKKYWTFGTLRSTLVGSFSKRGGRLDTRGIPRYARRFILESSDRGCTSVEFSKGPPEGVNSRITMKHRRRDGHAGMELLDADNVLLAENLTA